MSNLQRLDNPVESHTLAAAGGLSSDAIVELEAYAHETRDSLPSQPSDAPSPIGQHHGTVRTLIPPHSAGRWARGSDELEASPPHAPTALVRSTLYFPEAPGSFAPPIVNSRQPPPSALRDAVIRRVLGEGEHG